MKLLLTSSGLTNPCIAQKLIAMTGKPLQETLLLFMPTAARDAEAMRYVELTKQELFKLGFRAEFVTTWNLEPLMTEGEIARHDVVFVCGGNTFFLAKRFRESGFADLLKSPLLANKVYIGVSAGSNLAGPTIRQALPFDPNDVGLTDFSGMGLTTKATIPHAQCKPREILTRLREEIGSECVLLADGEALVVDGDLVEVVREIE